MGGPPPPKVRVLRRAALASARRDDLLREAKKAAQVKHEGLALVLEVGETDEDLYVSVERIEGERLSDRLRAAAPLGEREAASIAAQISRALAAAHDAGVHHRHLGPSLIALSGEGESTHVKVEGLATCGFASGATAPAESPEAAYTAPEVIRGEPAGRRADVYSIGAVLYAMLTGRAPDSRALEALEDLGVFGDVVKRCLAADPRDRFLDTVALGAALRVAVPALAPAPGPAPAPAPVSVRASRPDDAASSASRAPAAPPARPLSRPITARPHWEELLLDLGDGPLPRVVITILVVFAIVRIVTSGVVPFVVALAAGVAAYATWRRSRSK